MFRKRLQLLLLSLPLALPQPAPAQAARVTKSREALIREQIVNLDSGDIHVAAQAARELGYLRAAEAVPALLRVLQSRRHLTLSEHRMPIDKSRAGEWVVVDVRTEIVIALSSIGDRRAVPVLKKYLTWTPKGSELFPGTVAFALYRITGTSYKYRDREGKVRLYRPGGDTSEP